MLTRYTRDAGYWGKERNAYLEDRIRQGNLTFSDWVNIGHPWRLGIFQRLSKANQAELLKSGSLDWLLKKDKPSTLGAFNRGLVQEVNPLTQVKKVVMVGKQLAHGKLGAALTTAVKPGEHVMTLARTKLGKVVVQKVLPVAGTVVGSVVPGVGTALGTVAGNLASTVLQDKQLGAKQLLGAGGALLGKQVALIANAKQGTRVVLNAAESTVAKRVRAELGAALKSASTRGVVTKSRPQLSARARAWVAAMARSRREAGALVDGGKVYVVEAGDSLILITRKLLNAGKPFPAENTKYRELLTANPQYSLNAEKTNFKFLPVGRPLTLPASWVKSVPVSPPAPAPVVPALPLPPVAPSLPTMPTMPTPPLAPVVPISAALAADAKPILIAWAATDGRDQAGLTDYGADPRDQSDVWTDRDGVVLMSFTRWVPTATGGLGRVTATSTLTADAYAALVTWANLHIAAHDEVATEIAKQRAATTTKTQGVVTPGPVGGDPLSRGPTAEQFAEWARNAAAGWTATYTTGSMVGAQRQVSDADVAAALANGGTAKRYTGGDFGMYYQVARAVAPSPPAPVPPGEPRPAPTTPTVPQAATAKDVLAQLNRILFTETSPTLLRSAAAQALQQAGSGVYSEADKTKLLYAAKALADRANALEGKPPTPELPAPKPPVKAKEESGIAEILVPIGLAVAALLA